MPLNKELEERDLAEYQDKLKLIPPPTIEEREQFLAWIDSIQNVSMNIFYATAPDSLWAQEEIFTFKLVGCNGFNTALKRGIYCIDLPSAYDQKYRDPIAMAFAHLANAPEYIKQVPVLMGINLPKPTAHERMSAKMFFRQLALENKDNQEIVDWATQLN